MPAIRGLEGIQRFWEGARAMGVGRATLETVRLDQLGDGQACEIGNYSLQMPASGGQTTTERGKYVVIWKRQPDGAWKWHVDIWNGNG
jgi:ketosteroid isomerase-like protein